MREVLLILIVSLCSTFMQAQEKDTLSSRDTAGIKSAWLKQVTVSGKRAPVQILSDRTIVNVDASVTNTGATILEVLEKSPGISLDRTGNMSIKGRQGVTIMIDGKPAQVSGMDLNNLLAGMTAAQVDQIEIIDNPSSKYDASGNAGIVNIITKKNQRKGFNGNVNLSVGHGRFARTVNSISLSRYQGKLNLYANISSNYSKNFSDLYALRKYYSEDNTTLTAILEQPSYFRGRGPSQTIKAGVDFFLDNNTTLGMAVSGSSFIRKIYGNNDAVWKNENGVTDSVITTNSTNRNNLKNGGINLNARHSFSKTKELTADFDFLGYKINNNQDFTNHFEAPGGYYETLTGTIPSSINILTGKADYSQQFQKGMKMEAGWKSSYVQTNNRAEYYNDDGNGRVLDLGKTNHFLYTESIHALYGSFEKRSDKLTLRGGLRYEYTKYDAEQLGNIMRKDSSFSRNYDDLFPTATASLQADSLNNFSLSAGRRIDRPPFQSLNPFIFVINKYTYQSGNPYYRPQYTWNMELTHNFKNLLVTSVSYSITHDYFSQIFLKDSTGIIYYTEGNLDKMQNFGLSLSAQATPARWWSFSAQLALNHKKINGFVWNNMQASLTQLHLNVNNQFTFNRGWSGELSGFYTTREVELQEITDPTGQVSVGVAKQILNNKGTLKFLVRDIFYTQAMKGNTSFNLATEYFKITRDTRFASLAFTYRFGTSEKNNARKTGGADAEMRRVDTDR